ncbi:hypothetical protein ACLOJK_041173 [Asimina triloba]
MECGRMERWQRDGCVASGLRWLLARSCGGDEVVGSVGRWMRIGGETRTVGCSARAKLLAGLRRDVGVMGLSPAVMGSVVGCMRGMLGVGLGWIEPAKSGEWWLDAARRWGGWRRDDRAAAGPGEMGFGHEGGGPDLSPRQADVSGRRLMWRWDDDGIEFSMSSPSFWVAWIGRPHHRREARRRQPWLPAWEKTMEHHIGAPALHRKSCTYNV